MQSGSNTRKITAAFAAAIALLASSSRARADEPIRATEPTLMSEPGDVVEVVSAFDEKNHDPFDLNLTLGFHQSWTVGNIKRESTIAPSGVGSPTGNADSGFTHNIENIARYHQSDSVLNMRADVGLYHDLAAFFRVPLIIADDRSLSDLENSSAGVNAFGGRVADPATGKPMFNVPFTSPTRSGIDYIAAGLRWAIFNQARDPSKPTWTIELEGRFGVGEPLHACSADSNGACPNPSSVSYDPTQGYYRNGAAPYDAGISRGTNAVRFGTLASQRYRYVEPYGGFWFMAEFAKRGTAMGDFSGVDGVITNHPPLQGSLIGGLMIHPWENTEAFQRFTIDLRFNGTYVSQGLDYTPLFDALGTSGAQSLLAPNPLNYHLGPDGKTSVGNYDPKTGGGNVYFTGVTAAEAHGIFGGSLGLLVQANEFLKFNGGFGFEYIQAYDVTSADACNPDFASSTSLGAAGRCVSSDAQGNKTATGAPNPNHRPVLDLPGRRFRVTESFNYTLWINATLML